MYLLLPLVKNGHVYISAWCEVNRKTGRVVYVHRDGDDSSTYSFSAQTLTENPKKKTKWVTNTQQQRRDTQYKKKHEASFPFFSVLSTYRLWTRGARGGALDVQSSPRRRAALIRSDIETRGKDAANWDQEGGPGDGDRWALGFIFAGCFVCVESSGGRNSIFTAVFFCFFLIEKNRRLRERKVLILAWDETL